MLHVAGFVALFGACAPAPAPIDVTDDSAPRARSGTQGDPAAPTGDTGPADGPRSVARPDPSWRGAGVVGAEAVAAFDAMSASDQERLRSARVLFGHQSVGANMIQGAAALGYAFKTVSGSLDYAGPVRGEAEVAENHEPLKKIQSFEALVLGKSLGQHVDVAGFKFCWVDFYEPDKLVGLREAYASKVQAFREKVPQLRLFHVTPPLATREVAENKARLDFGDWMKKTFAERDVVLDLSAVESTKPDGQVCTSSGVRVLCPEYAADEGHLNAEGSKRAAKALLYAIARSLGVK